MDWGHVETGRLQGMRCPSCRRGLGGSLVRQVEWSARRCVVVVVCPSCSAECLAILEARATRSVVRPPIDVEDVRRAHELLAARSWQVGELFAA